jgi:hypothetical protein
VETAWDRVSAVIAPAEQGAADSRPGYLGE